MAGQVYKKSDEEMLAANVQTQAAAREQMETQARLAQLKPRVTSTIDHQRVVAQQILVEAYRSLEKGIPRDYSLRTLLG